MQSLKKVIRMFILTTLIILASVGVGLSGGIAIAVSKRREDNPVTIELVEADKEKSEDEDLFLF
ncbi:MAG: hypothetical protein WC623_10385 [Pedobacter sp.]|uniref:hypothetical protein n=1 Tax=Pedobacter sp. TaxID=1411316 RepID=UPI0035626D68